MVPIDQINKINKIDLCKALILRVGRCDLLPLILIAVILKTSDPAFSDLSD